MPLPECTPFGDCEFHKLSLEQIFKMLIIDDGNGCPTLKVMTNIPSSAKTPKIIVSTIDGNTPINVYSFSILFRGTGGKLDGVIVPDNYSANYGNGSDLITGSISYEVPTAGESRVIITELV